MSTNISAAILQIIPAKWRTPAILLLSMRFAEGISFSVWMTLLNNFAVERAAFTGAEMGFLQSIREIPGFLAFTAVFILLVMREQKLALVALLALGIGTTATGFFPNEMGLYLTTIIMSVGFHYYETMNQALTMQWIPKHKTPETFGRLIAVGSFASLTAYGLILMSRSLVGLDYVWIYGLAGGITMLITCGLWLCFPQFPEKVEQHKHLFLRQRYWLYYALTFMGGARRQIFMVFAAFMMVEKFDYSVEAVTLLYLVNHIINMTIAPAIGRLIQKWGERRALVFEYVGLFIVFTSYAFVDAASTAAILYVIDNMFFALAIAISTYFQKIADPADLAPTAGVAFTINHIAAVVIPASLGLLWLSSPSAVFLIGSAMAVISLILALMVPHIPKPGEEFVWKVKPRNAAAE